MTLPQLLLTITYFGYTTIYYSENMVKCSIPGTTVYYNLLWIYYSLLHFHMSLLC